MQESQNWAAKYYSPDAQATIEQRRGEWTPELQEKITADWQRMYSDVQSALDRNVHPTGPEAKALAERWMTLVQAFTGGNPEVLKGLNSMYADRSQWPQQEGAAASRHLPKPELMAFIRAAQQS